MDFNLVKISITVQSDDAFQLVPWLYLQGNTFADICRKNMCHFPKKVCGACSNQEACAWHLVFGKQLSADPSVLKRHQKPPLPFMFSFPTHPEQSENLSVTECGLIVIGHAIPHLFDLIDGFSELLADRACPVSAEVTGICSHDYQNTAHRLQDVSSGPHSENLVVLSSSVLFEEYTTLSSNLHILLNSPLRLSEDGRQLARFDFSRFARSLMRRVSSLAYYYGASEFDCDFKELSRRAEDVVCTEDRFSAAVGRDRKLSGIIGHGRFRGEFSGLMPFLVAGQYVHAGKGASFGMGSYELIPEGL
jgi:hypothetical protein